MRVPTRSALNGVGQRLDGQRLGETRNTLDQQVTLGQHGDHDAFEETVLADHDAFDLVEDLFHQLRGMGVLRGGRCLHGEGP
jgi:hypothetical protein